MESDGTMRQRAQVVRTEGSTAWVKVVDPSRGCGECSGCIRLTPKQKAEDQLYQVENPVKAGIGDWVILDQPTRELVKAVVVLYGLPLIGLLGGYAIAFWLLQSDAPAGLGALAGLIASVFIARPIARRAAAKAQFPQVVSRACS